MHHETRTFRGDTLEDALRQVREELGPEALVVRQREGVIGGIGGFFGRHCVEIDVQAPTTPERLVRVIPNRSVIDLYDSGEPVESAMELAQDDVPFLTEAEEESPLVRTLLEQASPFASQLAEAVQQFEADEIEAEPLTETVEPEPVDNVRPLTIREEEPLELPAEPETVEVPVVATRPEPLPTLETAAPASDPTSMRHHLATVGLDEALAASVVAEAETELRLFDPMTPFSQQVQTVLARRIVVRRSSKKRRRVIALIGPEGSGKTLAASRLCHAHRYHGGRTAAALSLEPLRKALELSRRLEQLDVELAVADDRTALEITLEKLADVEVLVVDTPAFDPANAQSVEALRAMLDIVAPDETHLLVPQVLDTAGVAALVGAAPALGADRLMLTRLDGLGSVGAAVAASIHSRIPLSFTSTGAPWGLRPADPYELAARIVS
jgi:flagellar biosynthesis GTPase FlhF